MHALCYLADLGNMILIACIMVVRNIILSHLRVKIIVHPLTPEQIVKDDLARAAKTAK
jgi:hypothetical protein